MNNIYLEQLINDFHTDRVTRFFREKSNKFAPKKEDLAEFNDEVFKEGIKLGEIKFDETEEFIVCAFLCENPLSERSGKKAQYEKAKKILNERASDAGIFVFYDKAGNFRFSLVYTNYLGNKRDWSAYKRSTYFVSKNSTNKTFLKRIGDCDFSTIEKINDAFSVEKVTKEFYQEISYWYFWAVQNCVFPKAAEKEDNGRNIAVIRLITRLIFVWFMRERGLVPKGLFIQEEIDKLLQDRKHDSSSYYQAILQNLFFATLSTKKDERVFRRDVRGNKGFNPDYGNQYVYRFQDYFIDPSKIQEHFKDIPFLNGGLFDCLDDPSKDSYYDGFTEIKKNQPIVPNCLFFNGETKVDINVELGTKGQTYHVRGLLNILSIFNFTIDENTSDDQEVALDPELLGRVFENLLASFNPETSSTARKATGSYYTPREIVDYMVDESLKGYLSTHINDIPDFENKIKILFSVNNEENPFDNQQSKRIVNLIESVRIVDPAVGSGAFPIGALNKLVFILRKIDKNNEFWKQAQLDVAENIPDSRLRQETKKRIELFFKEKNENYGRKLFLIQKCIYGVDIQQIAVEIAKLRFFISLLVDEVIDPNKENWGIEPLPNLDFKIMQGNSLISEFLGVKFEIERKQTSGQFSIGYMDEENKLIKEFDRKKIEYQNESDKTAKSKLLKEIEEYLIKIFEISVKQQKAVYFKTLEDIERKFSILPNKKDRDELIARETQKANLRFGFNLEGAEKQLREYTGKMKIRPFFLWQLYFAEVFSDKDGFDIVIGNPPYVSAVQDSKLSSSLRELYRKKYTLLKGSYDLYTVFILLGLDLISNFGIYSWIIPNKFLISDYSSKVKQNLISSGLKSSIDISFLNVFENGVYPIIIFGKLNGNEKFTQYSTKSIIDLTANELIIIDQSCKKYKTFVDFGIKIQSGTTGFQAQSIIKLISDFQVPDSIPFIVSGCVDRYILSNKNVRYMGHLYKNAFIRKGKEIANSKWSFWQNEKIVIAGMTKTIEAFYAEKPLALGVGVYGISGFGGFLPKFLLGVLNSKFLSYFLITEFTNKHLAGGYIAINKSTIEQLPLVEADKIFQDNMARIVDEIISKKGNYPIKEILDLENQIDLLVYELYGLTTEEIKVVEKRVNTNSKDCLIVDLEVFDNDVE
jgi:adenine-specific DNA-methyltransferase